MRIHDLNLFNRYLADKSGLREASIKDYTKIMNSPYGFADWLKKPINEITRDMVLAKRKQFTGGADNKMRVLRLLMNYAVALKAIDENPVDVMKDGSLWLKPTRRKRMIPSDNLKDWYNAVLNLKNDCFTARDTKNHSDFVAYVAPQIKPGSSKRKPEMSVMFFPVLTRMALWIFHENR